ncbi:MAG: conjugal transfer protein TraN [Rhodospirillales bacterium]|nr:conjugal transfer protein TraN [Rhodospirillales bacterium]
MSARRVFRIPRAPRAPDLLAWALLAAVCGFLLWIVFGGAAHADDPKAAARAIGNAGNAAARTIARDSTNAAEVPGYAGTNVPERGLTASGMENAARVRLADPDDPGGAAGRAVVRGTTQRPQRPVAAGDALVVRSEGIAASPQSPSHRADGLASGSTAACGADLQDAQDGGSCGQVTYCVGAGCETVRPQANTGFVEATTRLNMAVELGGEEFDRGNMRFFTGQRRACHIKLFGLANCCKNSGLLVGLGNCSASERELAEEHNAGNTHYLGRYCSKRTLFGVCIRRSRAWCVFGSKLGRILQQQGRSQLGIGWGSCRGLTVAEVEGIDFARLDLSEFTQDLMDGSREPSVSLPDAGDTGTAMRTRIRDFYRRGQ